MRLKIITWNIEGLKSQLFVFTELLLKHLPDLVFISEPLVFKTNVRQYLAYVEHEYCFHLNTDEVSDQLLSFQKSHAKGGTLVL